MAVLMKINVGEEWHVINTFDLMLVSHVIYDISI